MEQLIKQESQKHIAKQMKQARIRRQIQVRQQAMAWTETVRKKYDEAKEHEIKNLAEAVTEEAQNTAIENIRHLTTLHDLAMAEIGMAHRAAAGYQNVEKLKSLKRLKDEEVAKNRGTAAMMKLAKDNESKIASNLALLKRKEEVRKAEDKKSKEIISRRPLSTTNSNLESRAKPVILGPPDYQPSLAKTLRVASDDKSLLPHKQTKSGKLNIHQVKSPKKVRSPVKSASGSQRSLQPSKFAISAQPSKKSSMKAKSVDPSELVHKTKKKSTEFSENPQEGALKTMVRLRVSEPQRTSENLDYARVKFMGQEINLRGSSTIPSQPEVIRPETTTVRYYDDAIPKGEVKYIAPPGLAIKETRSSPDAWEKGKTLSTKLQEEQEKKTELEDVTSQKAVERGRLALKKARLEKQLKQIRTELLEGIDTDFELMGTGSQKAILGLDDAPVDGVPLQSNQDEDNLSDEFSAVESDEEFEFTPILAPQHTLKRYDVTEDQADKHIILVPNTKDDTSTPPDEASSIDSFGSYSSPSMNSEKEQIINPYNLEPLRPASESPMQKDDDEDFSLNTPKTDSPKIKPSSDSRSTLEKMAGSLVSHVISDATRVSPMSDRKETDSGSTLNSQSTREDIVSTDSRTSSGSTIAEINIRTTSGDTTTKGRKTDSLEDLQARANEQERVLQKTRPVVRRTSKENLSPDVSENTNDFINFPESTRLSESSEQNDGTKPIAESTNGLTSSGSSDSTSILVNIKLRDSTSTDSTPSRSEQSSVSTDYYNPPEGPFTSTPDGKLHPKRSSRSGGKSFDDIKKRTLYHYVDKFLAKKPESIENLPVTSSASSLIRADSDVLTSVSFEATFSPVDNSRSTASSKSTSSSSSSSNQSGSTFQPMPLPLLPVSEEDSEFDSGSTIAETAIKAAIGTETVSSESTPSHSHNKSDSRSETKESVSTSESLTYMLGALSTQQGVEKQQLEVLEDEGQSSSHAQVSGISSNPVSEPEPNNVSRRSSRSSSGSFPDASLILRQLRIRHKRGSTGSKSSEGSPKSGPEREAERVELLEDTTPVKLWETPPKYSVRSETEQLSEVFEKLIDKWANIRIEPPPWCTDLS
ncbi:unnamed protein product [Orchesella dallaii]|uniref:Uncharacterized protein n=1 Tax=Orchesella dallaii TaxID=48710 RepID=A0ABP1R1T6_9HEXA